MNGILMIAVEHPYYARMAVNLIRSIRSYDKQTPIQLVTNTPQYFPQEEKDLFTIIMPTEEKNAFYLKTKIYELSMFDNTIYLDVDMIALNKKIFKELFDRDVELSFACRGETELKDVNETTSQWANLLNIKKAYGLTEGKWLQLSSEFIQFKKTEKVKNFFNKAEEIYRNTQLGADIFNGVKPGLENGIGGNIPDELPFGISCILNGLYPESKFTPIYWAHAEKRHIRSIDPFINDNYYGYSMGGAHASQNQKEFYNMMMTHHLKRQDLKAVFFKAQNKSRYVKGREKI